MTAVRGPQGPEPAVRYEKRDVDPRAVVRVGIILCVIMIVTSAVLYPVFGWLRSRLEGQDPAPPPMGRQAPGRIPPEPRLQVAPPQDLRAVQKDAARVLETYGWVDEEKGVVRIPIEEAMRLLVERSASPGPSPAPAPASPAAPAGGPVPGRTP